MILVRGKVDLRDIRVREHARVAEEQVSRARRGEASLLCEGGGENVDRESTAKLRNVTVRVPIVEETVSPRTTLEIKTTHLINALHLIL